MSVTSIEWTDFTFNPWWGCVRVSPGCERCYAETFSHRLGMELWGPAAPRRFFGKAHWDEPLKWQRRRQAGDARHLVFCASMADVFEDRRDLDGPRAALWDLIAATPDLTWQLLTKRPENTCRLTPTSWAAAWPKNVWAMVTAEDQERADRRIPELLQIPARVRAVSYEPALGPVDFTPWVQGWEGVPIHVCSGDDVACRSRCPEQEQQQCDRLDLVIVGGESGPGARPFDVEWARSTVRQCREAGTKVFVKQLGARPYCEPTIPAPSDRSSLRDRKGSDPSEWPEDLRVHELPA